MNTPDSASTHPLLDRESLKQLCMSHGADDAGVVSISRSELDADRSDILQAFPPAKTLISIVCRMNRAPVRSPMRSIANNEFHHTGEFVNEVCRKIVGDLERSGIGAVNPAMGFPMEMSRFGNGKTWIVSHKLVAEAAGLGKMGIHRNLIHPRFGSFVLLGTIILDAAVTGNDQPLETGPCVSCKLCVAACPTGAISPDGAFHFSACYTHNYREFMSGFTDWVETVAGSRNARDYRQKVTDQETVSMWQSLSYGANYKAAYCIAVCPAGDDVIPPFRQDRPAFLQQNVRPLQDKMETVYAVAGSDVEAYVQKRFPHKKIKRVANGLRPATIAGFLGALPVLFQPGAAKGLNATYHYIFRGKESREATVIIRDQKLQVLNGCQGRPDLRIEADSESWVHFIRKDRSLMPLLLRRKIKIRGPVRFLKMFAKCFPA